MLTPLLQKLMNHQDLSYQECYNMQQLLLTQDADHTHNTQAGALLSLLHCKHETADELFGLRQALCEQMQRVTIAQPALDIVGTGGDGANTVNISTAASLVAAAAGVPVVKHGNRSVSSRCGSADLLEEFGINLHANAEQIQKSVNQNNFGFCFAPHFHTGIKKIASLRKALGIRTSFNLLGPLLNPAEVSHYIMGVYDPYYLPVFAEILQKMPIKRAMVVHGAGLDELSCLGKATIYDVTPTGYQQHTFDPKDFGFNYCELADLQGGDAETNAKLILSAFAGKPSPLADSIAINAGAGIYLYGLTIDLQSGIQLAKKLLTEKTVLSLVKKIAS